MYASYFIFYYLISSLNDFNISDLKFSLLSLELLLSSLLVGLVSLRLLVADGGGIENDLVALVVVIGFEVVGIVCRAVDGRSLMHTVPETKWYPVGHVPPGSGLSTIGTLVVVVMPVLLLLLIVLLGNCANGAADGDEIVVWGGVAAADNKGGFTVFAIPHMPDSVVLTTLRSGLLGSHIFALISGDIVVLGELAIDGGDDADNIGEDDCWAYTWKLLQIAKISILATAENIVKSNLE